MDSDPTRDSTRRSNKENIPETSDEFVGAKNEDDSLKNLFNNDTFQGTLKRALRRQIATRRPSSNGVMRSPIDCYELPRDIFFDTLSDETKQNSVEIENVQEENHSFDALSILQIDGIRYSKRLRTSSTCSTDINSPLSYFSKKKKVASHDSMAKPKLVVGEEYWLQRMPIFVADGRRKKIPKFPERKRSTFCFFCGEKDNDLTKCSASGCSTSFHEFCARMHIDSGYNIEFMQRNRGTYCPRHHCTGCFADHNRVRCFNGALVRCNQCELAWHPDCIPGGCELVNKSEIICPRHIAYPNHVSLHTSHCADCQQECNSSHDKSIRCDLCLRSLHEKCYRDMLSASDRNSTSIIEDLSSLSEVMGRCNWCRSFDFVRYGQYCMGRLATSKWYPCQVVRNDEYPRKQDANFGRIGFMVVKWLPYQNKIFYNLISHNRVLPMTEKDYFFVTEAKHSNIYEEWALAQQHALMNSPENSVPKPDQIDMRFSNGERVRKITRCKYTLPELRSSKLQLPTSDLCVCPVDLPDRCGPTSNCINRALRIECPKLCESKGSCGNRVLSNGENCVKVSIEPCHGRYFGAVTLEDIPLNGFVGEYVGEIITHEEKQRRIDRIARMKSIEAQYYIMDLDAHRAIDAMYFGNDMRYVNHSCQPNCSVQVIASELDIHLVLVALRKINKGEELSFDYNMYSTNSGRDVPKCRCNAENCSGILSAAGVASNGGGSNGSGKDVALKRKLLTNVQNSAGKQKAKSTKTGSKVTV